MTTTSLRAVGYRRVSMKEQLDGFSLEAQAENIRKYAIERHWKLIQIYTDAGLSAKKDSERPELKKLLQDAEKGEFDIVIVDKIDRFYRHLNGLLNTLDRLNNQKVSFVSVQERIDFTTPWGKLTLTMLGMLAEIYLDNLRMETEKGKKQRARDGWWNGNIPLGYCKGLCSKCHDPNGPGYCPNAGQPDKSDGQILIIHPVDGDAVRLAFDLYLNKMQSDLAIAEALNQTEFLLPNGKITNYRQKGIMGRKVPGSYTKDFVRGMLTQVFYTGKVAYYGKGRKRKAEALYPGRHPAIISEDDFHRVAEIRESMKRVPYTIKNTKSRVYPLTGIAFCGECGWPLRGTCFGKKTNFIYKDAGQVERRGIGTQKHVSAIPLEREVMEFLYQAAKTWKETVNPEQVMMYIDKFEMQVSRANELYILGETTKDVVERERQRVSNIVRPWKERSFLDTTLLTQKILAIYPDWSHVKNYDQKTIFRQALERVFIHDNAIVAVQPTPEFLPVFDFLQVNKGKQISSQYHASIELLPPGLGIQEAMNIIKFRTTEGFEK